MALRDTINQNLTASMKEGDALHTGVLRMLKSSLQMEQIKLGHELTEAEVLKVLQREAKQRKEAIIQYEQGGRDDLVAGENQELEIIEAYLPKQMDDAELEAVVKAVISETGAKDITQLGVVMSAVMQRTEGRADGAKVAQYVRQSLGS
ncbi:MAG TPA: GatB/YqeY domain-containing protein [Candidatus Saccharimonadia bacterium]